MPQTEWKQRFGHLIGTAEQAMALIHPGDHIFIGTGCAQPQHLVSAMVHQARHIYDAHIIHLLTMGAAPYATEALRDRFKLNSFFVADNVRDALERGLGDYTPVFLSEIPQEFESGRIPIDVALISVTPPDASGLCSFGVSVDIVKSAAANAKCVIAQVNPRMPRTMGDSFIRADRIDMLVPFEEPMITTPVPETDETLRGIGAHLARLVEDGSTIECGIGRLPQALVEALREKVDLGVHTEMFGDWVIDLMECGAITGAKKTINRGKVVASFCMGSQRLYDYVDNNPAFEFRPTEYVNDPFVIAQHEKMVAINVGLEVDLTGQVCADSLGYRIYSGIGGQVDFIRGAARSRGGKAIIAMPSTAQDGKVSRIVAHLAEGAGVVTTRGDVHYVVSEFGIAYLHAKSIRERALALINIAHPSFRNGLIEAAKRQKYLPPDQIELPWDQVQYPQELERYESLRDGTGVFFRPVKPTDEKALADMLYSLSSPSVRTRYFTQNMSFPHKIVQKLVNVDYRTNLAIVGAVPGPAGEEIVALAEYFVDPKAERAEVAFLVLDEWQQKGMGTFLMNYLIQIARKRGIRGLDATVMPENKAMLAIFQNCGLKMHLDFDGNAYAIKLDVGTKAEPERGGEAKKE